MTDYSKVNFIAAHSRAVELWFDSPTGGVTDSQIFIIACESYHQAEIVAEQWARRHGMVWHDIQMRPVNPLVETRLGVEVL